MRYFYRYLIISCVLVLLTACAGVPTATPFPTSATPKAGHWAGEFGSAMGTMANIDFDIKAGNALTNLVLKFGEVCTLSATKDVVLPVNPTAFVEIAIDDPASDMNISGTFETATMLAGTVSGRCGGRLVAMGTFTASWEQ